MSDENQQKDSLQPSWATRELFALGVTLVLAVWVVAKYGKETQPQSITAERDKARAEKRAELQAADEEALENFAVIDSGLKRYRLPIYEAMKLVVEKGKTNSIGITKEIEDRLDLKLVEIPAPDFLADESELDDPELIAKGKALFTAKICFTCHQTDPAVPAPAGVAMKAPKYIGDFWGKETLVHKGTGGPLEKVIFGPGYFYESVKDSMIRIAKGALAPMPPLPPPTDEEIKALMAYVKSLSKK